MKLKKISTFLVIGTLLIGLFNFNAKAEVINPNDGEWYRADVMNILGAKNALKVAGVRFTISNVSEEGYFGSLVIHSISRYWDQKEFYSEEAGAITTAENYIEYTERSPFFSAGDDWAEILIIIWVGDCQVDLVEFFDIHGNLLEDRTGVSNANHGDDNEWYRTDVLKAVGKKNLLKITGVKFYISDLSETPYIGTAALESPSRGWYGIDFKLWGAGQVTAGADYIEYWEAGPFFNAGDEEHAYVDLAVWQGAFQVDRVEFFDAEGDLLFYDDHDDSGILNPNYLDDYGNKWYKVNVLEAVGAENALRIAGVKFNISNVPAGVYSGELVLYCPERGWDSMGFNSIEGGSADAGADYIEYKEENPFFSAEDVGSWAEILVVLWQGYCRVDKVEFFDADGNVITSGTAKNGWMREDGGWYFYINNDKRTGWFQDGGIWYYLHPASGLMQTGWVLDGGAWYFMRGSGAMAEREWVYDGGIWYYLKPGGAMAESEWIYDGGIWYYLKPGGVMAEREWVNDGGIWYYLKPGGAMAEREWVYDGGIWYYLKHGGVMASGEWLQDPPGVWYYLLSSGVMATGTVHINGQDEEFAANGIWVRTVTD